MIRLAAAALAVVLASVPLAILPSPAVAIAAAASLALSLAGVAVRARPVIVAGVSLAWIAYVIALSGTTAGLDLASAIGIGTVSFLLLEIVDFAGRFDAVSLPRAVIVSQIGWWLTFCLAVAGLVIVAAAVATLLARPMPPPVAAAMALAASVLTVVSALRLLRP